MEGCAGVRGGPGWGPRGGGDAICAPPAARGGEAHRAATAEHSARLERAWAAVPDWSEPAEEGVEDPLPPVFTRLREVWIHLLDLDLGVRPAEWDVDFATHTVGVLLPRLPDGVALRATDVPRTWVAGAGVGREVAGAGVAGREVAGREVARAEVVGGVRDLAAWLAGRTPDGPPVSAAPLPGLGPWPAYPAHRRDLPR
ncbi:maleylpyruvate isomerase N-terminal domain-containing protein [Actinosynnema sp. NPDC059335]|uniref:maleylpyruvate isomerase N-terminal domain-containing protein n=1 Tax=Actinosynnema sp. NPDC059335 TaxID=3346804 RepID=UPI00366BD480